MAAQLKKEIHIKAKAALQKAKADLLAAKLKKINDAAAAKKKQEKQAFANKLLTKKVLLTIHLGLKSPL